MLFALSMTLTLPENVRALESYCPMHDYGSLTLTPSEDYRTCTASRKCMICPATETATGTLSNTHTVHTLSCEADGVEQYLYTFSENWVLEAWKEKGVSYGDTVWVTRTTPKLGHLFTKYVRDEDAHTLTATCDREGCEATDTISDTFLLPEYYPEEETTAEGTAEEKTEAAVAPKTGETGSLSAALAVLSLGALLLAVKKRAAA